MQNRIRSPQIKMQKAYSVIMYICVTLIMCKSENPLNDDMCDICKCSFEENTASVDCSERDLKIYVDRWTNFTSNINTTKYTHFVVTFKSVILNDLNVLPGTNVSTVDLSFVDCNLTNIQEGAFKNIEHLNSLDFSFNRLRGVNMKDVMFKTSNVHYQNAMQTLQTLNLGNNMIHSFDRRMFKYTPELRVLFLNDNPLEVFDLPTTMAISEIRKLEVLDVSRTGISDIPEALLRNLKNLKDLNLTGNKFTTVPESLGILGNTLETLTLNENRLVTVTDNSFLGILWRVETLRLSGMTTLTSIKENAFIQLKSLIRLHVCSNPSLERISRDAFDGIKINWRLKEIRLDDNNLKSLPGELMKWDSIDEVNLENNPWICDCEMGKLLNSSLRSKLTRGSHPRCSSPIERSGTELSELRIEEVCPTRARPGDGKRFGRPHRMLIVSSVLVILTIVAIIIGVRITRWRKNLQRFETSTVRYAHVGST